MKNLYKPSVLLFLLLLSISGFSQTTFFNEVDYKTAAPNQCLEVVSPTTQDRTGWNVVIYNDNGFLIETIDLGVIAPSTTVNDFDIIIVDVILLTDPKGGMAIEDNTNAIVQFLNYGTGTITAQDGPAVGLTSENIGVQSVAGFSLQLTGSGTEYVDFVWALPGAATCGEVNLLQDLLSPLLPVELAHFGAELRNDKVEVQWTTTSEQNSLYYLLERSVNGSPFTEIYRTEAAGYSEEKIDYQYLDRYPPEGQLYYRLTEVDYDGRMMKSDIVTVNNYRNKSNTYVFPNPANDELHLVLPEVMDYLNIEIYDIISGRRYLNQRIEQPGYQIPLNINELNPGQYVIRLRSTNYIYEQRFVKLNTH